MPHEQPAPDLSPEQRALLDLLGRVEALEVLARHLAAPDRRLVDFVHQNPSAARKPRPVCADLVPVALPHKSFTVIRMGPDMLPKPVWS